MEKQYLNAEDVQNLMQVGRTKSYDIIKKVNERLEKEGYMTVRGRVPKAAIYDFFGINRKD